MSLVNSISIEADLQLVDSEILNKSENGMAKTLTTKEKVKLVLGNVTVEPVVGLFMIASAICMLANQNLNLEKACRVNIGYNETICDAMSARDKSGYTEMEEAEVQKLVSTMASYKMFITGSIPCLIMMFLGSWSDRHRRRKPVIIAPLFGCLVGIGGVLFCTYFYLELPIEVVAFFESVPIASTGGHICLTVGVFSYVSGKCDRESRTVRIGAVTVFLHVSFTLGIAISGIMYKTTGFYGVYCISLILTAMALAYGWIVIKDDKQEKVALDGKERIGFLKDFFDINHIKNTLLICFKEGPNNRKKKVIVIMTLAMLTYGPLFGEASVLYLYTRRKFGWNEMNFSAYNTFHFALSFCGTIFSLAVFSKRLKLDDAVLGIIALCSKLIASMIFAFVPEGKYFYVGGLFEMLSGPVHIALRSTMSKLVPVEELGQTNSFFGVCESFIPIVYAPLYSIIYNHTVLTFPGAFFIFTFVMNIPSLILFVWLYKQNTSSEQGVEGKKHHQEQHLLTKEEITINKEKTELKQS